MSQSKTVTDQQILQAISTLEASGQNITSWAVQAHLDGGDFSQIDALVNSYQPLTPPVESLAIDNKKQQSAEDFLTEDIIDKSVPTNIESSMSQMQNALGEMANKIWVDAATKAEDQVREKLFSVQQAHDQVKDAYLKTKTANQEMQGTLEKLNNNLEILEKNYQESQSQLAHERNELSVTKDERDALAKSVDALEEDNHLLEQTAFNSKLEIAKSEGLAETVKEQLALIKESEKQLQVALDRSEKKVDELNLELHDVSKTLREEVRDRLATERIQKQQEQLTKEPSPSSQQYPPQELPKPRATNIPPLEPAYPPAKEPSMAPAEISAPEVREQLAHSEPQRASSVADTIKQDTAQLRPKLDNVTQKKTRSLSEKLFDRKRTSPKRLKR